MDTTLTTPHCCAVFVGNALAPLHHRRLQGSSPQALRRRMRTVPATVVHLVQPHRHALLVRRTSIGFHPARAWMQPAGPAKCHNRPSTALDDASGTQLAAAAQQSHLVPLLRPFLTARRRTSTLSGKVITQDQHSAWSLFAFLAGLTAFRFSTSLRMDASWLVAVAASCVFCCFAAASDSARNLTDAASWPKRRSFSSAVRSMLSEHHYTKQDIRMRCRGWLIRSTH